MQMGSKPTLPSKSITHSHVHNPFSPPTPNPRPKSTKKLILLRREIEQSYIKMASPCINRQRRTRQRREGENRCRGKREKLVLWLVRERERDMKSLLNIWAPPTLSFYKNATMFIFIENEKMKMAKSCIHFLYSNLKMNIEYKNTTKPVFLWWISQKTENEYWKPHFFLLTKQPLKFLWIKFVFVKKEEVRGLEQGSSNATSLEPVYAIWIFVGGLG